MLDIPAELLIIISTHMGCHDLRVLAVTSQSICRLLLPEYLRRCGLVLEDSHAERSSVKLQVCDQSGYASLGLWSVSRIFRPPREMYCSIPHGAQEARSAMEFLMRFLLQFSNTHSLQDFHLSLRGSNTLLLMPQFVKMQRLLYALPYTRLCFSGYSSVDCLPPSIALLRNGSSRGSRTLTSLVISSDYAFAPGLAQATMGVLRHSPIETLTIYMVSLNSCQWSTLLGGLHIKSLKNIDFEGDIPHAALIRFLMKHKDLKDICIRGNVRSGRAQPGRLRNQPILSRLQTFQAPLAVCCDVAERLGDSSNLYKLHVEVSQHHPHDPSFLRLVEILGNFRQLDHLGLHLVPNLASATSQASLDDHDWDEHPVHALRKVHTLTFFQSLGHRLSPEEIVRPQLLPTHLSCLTHDSDRT